MSSAGTIAFLLLGLAGSLHCIGMCGGLAIAAVRSGTSARSTLGDTLLFALGKACTYVVLGGLLTTGLQLLFGHQDVPFLHGLRRGLTYLTGGLLVLSGAWMILRRPLGRVRWLPTARIVALASSMRGLGGPAGVFGAGAVTGLLPCGLSWSALLLATQLPPVPAALGLFVFGLATAPSLTLAVFGWSRVRGALQPRAQTVLGLLVAGIGVVTIARGGFDPGAVGADSCCVWADGTAHASSE